MKFVLVLVIVTVLAAHIVYAKKEDGTRGKSAEHRTENQGKSAEHRTENQGKSAEHKPAQAGGSSGQADGGEQDASGARRKREVPDAPIDIESLLSATLFNPGL